MNEYFGYTRVSTAKQGEGVSLAEQKASIERYAARERLSVSRWFEERETAAKRGRPVWSTMLKLLRQGKARGVVIHKIDRSARNLKDWADLGELLDEGVEVHFAHESMDMGSRGGRLAADIQAVVAADYVRNLREETKKGFYGRLKQGLYPLRAPLGYRDEGGGKAKSVDPVAGPLVRLAFELYATGDWTFQTLEEELHRRGLRNRDGGRVTKNGLSSIFNNPFYYGLIRLKSTGETFEGAHEPLIGKALFEDVQEALQGRYPVRVRRHEFLFRRLLACGLCGRTMIGELQKGRVYYRCHDRQCLVTSIRGDRAEGTVHDLFSRIRLLPEEKSYAFQRLEAMIGEATGTAAVAVDGLRLSLGKADERLQRLMDAYLDRDIEKDAYQERRERLLGERLELERRIAELEENPARLYEKVGMVLERSNTAQLSFEIGELDEKRELLRTVTSNRRVFPENLSVELRQPFPLFLERHSVTCGAPSRAGDRKGAASAKELDADWLITRLISWAEGTN